MTRNQKNSEPNERRASRLGSFGESAASEFLRLRGYRIVARNYKTAIGRNRKGVALFGEIDLIVKKGRRLCFVEVKTRSHDPNPEASVNIRKQRQITRTARVYMNQFEIGNISHRFDVLSIVKKNRKAPVISHFKDFWRPEKFINKRWSAEIKIY